MAGQLYTAALLQTGQFYCSFQSGKSVSITSLPVLQGECEKVSADSLLYRLFLVALGATLIFVGYKLYPKAKEFDFDGPRKPSTIPITMVGCGLFLTTAGLIGPNAMHNALAQIQPHF
jgi:hypothetical protein